jgi:hypothetical protein
MKPTYEIVEQRKKYGKIYGAHRAPDCPNGSLACEMARTTRTLWRLPIGREVGQVLATSVLHHVSYELHNRKGPFLHLFKVVRTSIRNSREACEVNARSEEFDPAVCVCETK